TRTINTLALALVAPLAFGQSKMTDTDQRVGPDVVTTYEPGKIIVVASETAPDTFSCVLDKSLHYMNTAGRDVDELAIKPGTPIHVYFEGAGLSRVIKRVVIDED